MIAILAPDLAPYLGGIAGRAGLSSPSQPIHVLAPWALPEHRLWRSIARRSPFARRRLISAPPGAILHASRLWTAAELSLATWSRGRTDRRLRAVFWRRAALDRAAAAWLARQREITAVIAPTGAAERSFAVAAARGARCILLEDLPALRQLQDDLDRAAATHPGCRFLRRYRAARGVIARQEAEWALASELWVRGRFARRTRMLAGIAADRLVDWYSGPVPPAQPDRTVRGSSGRAAVLLAGLAAARAGTMETLAMLEARDDIELFVRPGEGLEPDGLLRRPRVHPVGLREVATFDLVVAPAWCESHPPELAAAAAAGVPAIASDRASGFLDLPAVEPGDTAGLLRAVDRAL